ncbi:hypothetical protein QBC46DRAFT_177074 [Diplogelasinospora grovesii]|uniref:Uncharacterized protein n=1 Tax=Diplogelasinospora grovesii TaxID=303347 RepID=A0AAN6S2P3_9PEZI|nr:hypothetical protein QBC46DRAFT_177074 [Diplogelasinospora grovesii]
MADLVFLYPTENLTFNTLDTINVTYIGSFETPSLFTFCDWMVVLVKSTATRRSPTTARPQSF